MAEPGGRNSLETRVRLLEQYVTTHSHDYQVGTQRLNDLWDWYKGIVPQLKNMVWLMRILVAALIGNLALGAYGVLHH
jgi:hypothetical protein